MVYVPETAVLEAAPLESCQSLPATEPMFVPVEAVSIADCAQNGPSILGRTLDPFSASASRFLTCAKLSGLGTASSASSGNGERTWL